MGLVSFPAPDDTDDSVLAHDDYEEIFVPGRVCLLGNKKASCLLIPLTLPLHSLPYPLPQVSTPTGQVSSADRVTALRSASASSAALTRACMLGLASCPHSPLRHHPRLKHHHYHRPANISRPLRRSGSYPTTSRVRATLTPSTSTRSISSPSPERAASGPMLQALSTR